MTTRDKNIVGEVLAKTYRIERFLGVGTIGTVYVARHVRSGGLYAVKVLHRKLAASPDLYQRFQDEARLIATLRHPHIVPITDFDRDESGTPFFVMDLLEGETLQQRLKHKEVLPVAQAMEIVQQIGSALHAAHRSGIVHRNVTPDNIYLVRHDLGDRVTETAKITDFGLARFRRPAPAGTREAAQGVSAYMAPELLQEGAAPADGRVDQWALAVIAYRTLSGKLPFDDSSPEDLLRHILNDPPRPISRLLPDLPAHVSAALSRGMANRREDRYETMMDFVRAVTTRGTGSSAKTPPPIIDGESAVPQPRLPPPSGRVAAVMPPVPSGRIAAPPPPSGAVANRPPPPPPPSPPPPPPATAATPPAPGMSPPVPAAGISSPAVPPVAVAPPAAPPPVVEVPPAIAAPPAVPVAPAAATPVPSSATPPLLMPPPLLLPENNSAPVPTVPKGPSWGIILGGAAVAVLAGLGLTVLFDGRRPNVPPHSAELGSVVVGPGPTTPVVEALDLETPPPPPPPPPVADAASHGPTPIAPHVPLPPLRTGDPGEGTLPAAPPAGTAPAAVPDAGTVTPGTKPAGSAAGTPTGTPATGTTPRPASAAQSPGGTTGEPSTAGSSEVGNPAAGRTSLPPPPRPSVDSAGATPAPASAGDTKEPKEKNADEMMKEAQAAYVRGERGRAMELALQVTEGGGADAERAWRFIGSAACSVRNALMANKAYTQLSSPEHKQMLLELCQRNGLAYQNGAFVPSD